MQPYILQAEPGNDPFVDDRKVIGARIKARRLELEKARGRRFTQRELGKLAGGIEGDVVSKHERGDIGFSLESLTAYASALETTTDWLSSGGVASPKPGPKPQPDLRVVSTASGVPEPIWNLTNANPQLAPITEDEREHLTRHLNDPLLREGHPLDLEIVLRMYRAFRDNTVERERELLDALRRKRKLLKAVTREKSSAPEHAE